MSTPEREKLKTREKHKKEFTLNERKRLLATLKVKKEFILYEQKNPPYIRGSKTYPSFQANGNKEELLKNGIGKKEHQRYTGDYIIGIATMHKSNLVPISRDDNPIDYSTMRRN